MRSRPTAVTAALASLTLVAIGAGTALAQDRDRAKVRQSSAGTIYKLPVCIIDVGAPGRPRFVYDPVCRSTSHGGPPRRTQNYSVNPYPSRN